jgi:hypothetical protein
MKKYFFKLFFTFNPFLRSFIIWKNKIDQIRNVFKKFLKYLPVSLKEKF